MKNESCPTCSEKPTYPALLKQEGTNYAVLCGRDTIQVVPDSNRNITIADGEKMAKRLKLSYRVTDFFHRISC